MRSFISDGIAGKLAAMPTPAAVFGFDAVEHGARKARRRRNPTISCSTR